MSEQLPHNPERLDAEIFAFADKLVAEAKNKAKQQYGFSAVSYDYFRSYEQMTAASAMLEMTYIKSSKKHFYTLTVSDRWRAPFSPHQYMAVNEEDSFVALQYKIHENNLYADGLRSEDSEPEILELKAEGYDRVESWLRQAAYGNYLPPGKDLPLELDRLKSKF